MDSATSPAPARGSAYDAAVIEPKWQERWREQGTFHAVRDPGRAKTFVYNPAPYVTGSLHMGHVRNYACGDFYAKYRRMQGDAVLYTLGFDAYGLPTEMAAIRHASDPEVWTADCLKEMKGQLVALGCGFDWRRSFITSDPRYYKWTQWLFLKLLEQDLVYSARGRTHWCPRCETTLAHAQVMEGACWICATPVETRPVREWRLRLTAHLGDLLRGLRDMRDLNGLSQQGQEVLIGEHTGFRVELKTARENRRIQAFLRRKEDWLATCALAVHATDEASVALFSARDSGTIDPDAGFGPEALTHAIRAFFPDARYLGTSAVEPLSGRDIPVFVVTATDPAFFDQPALLPLRSVPREDFREGETAPDFPSWNIYRQKDFSISRQRLWGTPIPIVLCPACGEVPVPEELLPVPAPRVIFDRESGKLRRESDEGDLRNCPRCGMPARLDPQVMDCHMDSIWHPFRPCAVETTDFLFDPAEVAYWMPVDIIQFGRDVVPFMLDLRFLSHFLHRLGHVPFREFAREVLVHGLVLHQGRKMSKHLENAVRPDEIIRKFGADALRFYILAHAEPRSDFRWSDAGLERYHAVLSSYHEMIRRLASNELHPGSTAPENGKLSRYTNVFLKKAEREIAVLETSVDQGRYDRYAGSLEKLLSAMDFFSANHLAHEGHPGFVRLWQALVESSVAYLAPVAPHLAEECWELRGGRGSVFTDLPFPRNQAGKFAELSGT